MNPAFVFEQFESDSLIVHPAGFQLVDFERPTKDEVADSGNPSPESELTPSEEEMDAEAHRETIARLAALTKGIEDAWVSGLAAATAELAERSSQSIGALLPNLLSDFGAAQLAASIVAVVEKADLKSPALLISLEDHDCVIEALSELGSPNQIEVRKSGDQAPGTASLHWEHGGAELDLSDFLASARHMLERTNPTNTNGVTET